MIPVAEASARILERIARLPAETVATESAVGRVLASSVTAPITSPPWDNSSMDGYAARSEDLPATGAAAGAGRAAGAVIVGLRVVATIAAGQFAPRPLAKGEAMRIMTGAPIPDGADSVIRIEDTDGGADHVSIHNIRDRGRNIRRAGEDFKSGDLLFAEGEAIGPAHIGALASAGIKNVDVYRRPRVALISSGDELVELRDFSSELGKTKIVSSNSLTLAALVRDAGGEPVDLGIARDDPASLREKLEAARGCDLIVTSAGISVGDHDHVRDVIGSLGGELIFWKVRMRPGAPLAFGTLGGIPWLGLSGNPVSAMVTFELFVRPAMRRMLGFARLFRRTIPVTVAEAITLAAPLTHFMRVVVTLEADNSYSARLAGSQSSSVLTAMARANALLILPGDRLEIAAGEAHRALPLGDNLETSIELALQ